MQKNKYETAFIFFDDNESSALPDLQSNCLILSLSLSF